MHQESYKEDQNFSFKALFNPLTTLKAFHWVAVIGLIVYANVLFNGFVWDDLNFIVFNPDVHQFNLVHLLSENNFNTGNYYRPVSAIYFSVLYGLFGAQPFFFHLAQIMLHIFNACLLFYLLKKFFSQIVSFFLVLVFLIHPIQVESVAFIGASQNQIFFLFGITALIISMKDKLAWRQLLSIAVLILLCILTKETGVLFFIPILAYRLLFNPKQRKLLFLASGITLIVYVSIRMGIGGVFLNQQEYIPIAVSSLGERLFTMPAIFMYYITTFLFPKALAIDQHWVITTPDLLNFYLPLCLVLLIVVLLLWLGILLRKKYGESFHSFLFFTVWFLAGMGFHLQIFPLDMTVADRWFYFPIVGLLGLIGVTVSSLSISRKRLREALFVCVILILVLFSVRTMVRNSNWVNGMTLYTHDIKIYDSSGVQSNLAHEYISLERYDEALHHAKRSVEILPSEYNLQNVGYIYQKMGNLTAAKQYYEKSLMTAKHPPEKHKRIEIVTVRNLGIVYLLLDENQSAQEFVTLWLKTYPQDGQLWMFLAISEYRLSHQDVALAAAGKAKELLPNSQTEKVYRDIVNKKPIKLNAQ